MARARLILENELHYHIREVANPDYLDWAPADTVTFAYGYFTPESRVRLTLICPTGPVDEVNVRAAVLETKVFLDDTGNRRVKTVCDLSVTLAMNLYDSASRVMGKTVRTYLFETGAWQLSFKPYTFELTAAEFVLDSSTSVDRPEPPNFVSESFPLTGETEFYTFDQAMPRI